MLADESARGEGEEERLGEGKKKRRKTLMFKYPCCEFAVLF